MIELSVKNIGKNTLRNIEIRVGGEESFKITESNGPPEAFKDVEITTFFGKPKIIGEDTFHINSIEPDSIKSFSFKITARDDFFVNLCHVFFNVRINAINLHTSTGNC